MEKEKIKNQEEISQQAKAIKNFFDAYYALEESFDEFIYASEVICNNKDFKPYILNLMENRKDFIDNTFENFDSFPVSIQF